MIFELWGNLGLRKGDYKLWADVGREHSPDWDSEIAALEHTDLALFDLSKDIAEKSDLRKGLPEVYASLKAELIDHFANINTEYPLPETSGPSPKEKPAATPKPKSPAPSSDARTPEKFFKARDRNDDGVVNLEEFIGNPKERNVPALTKRFKQFDANGDGRLSIGELKGL